MKKFSSIFLSVTTTISLTGVLGIIPVAHAQSIADLQAQIAALQAALNALQGSSVSAPAASFNRNLTVGSRGADVTALQDILISKGHLAAGLNTGYFGNLTKAAVAKWQASMGISPAVGFVGPISRASLNSMGGVMVPGSPVVVPGSGLSVSVAAGNPPAGSLISSTSSAAARVGVLKVNLTASSLGAVVVNDLKFRKVGVLSDSSISSAYLVENGQVIQQYSYVNSGVVGFSGMNLVVNAGQTRSLLLAIDPASGLSAGNSVSFNLDPKDVMTAGGVPVSGSVVAGNTQTVTSVSNPSIAALTVASASVGTSVYAGTQNVLVSQWTLTTTNSPVNLSSIAFKVTGSANKTDLKNVKLYLNGSQIGSTLSSVASDGVAYFDLSAVPARVNTGSGNLQVYADIMGSPSYTFKFQLLNTYNVLAIDTQYQTGVAVTINGGAGIEITISKGQITVTASTDTPTGNIAKGGSGTVLGKFTIYAAGEAVKVKFLDFQVTFTGTTGTLSTIFKNIALVDDTGLQVGTTINTPPTTNACEDDATPSYNAAGTIYIDCFGTSASPVNYIVPANTARTLSLRADVQTDAAFTTVTAALNAMTNNLQGLTSAETVSSGSATGAALTLSTTPLSATKNNALGTPNYAKGASGVRIGSFVLTASSAEAVNVSNLTVTMSASSTNFQNAMVKVGSTQFGTTKATLSGSDAITFSGSAPIVVPKGGSQVVDVYADVLSGTTANTYTGVTTLTSCTGTGSVSNASNSCSPTSVAGQDVQVSAGATLNVALDQTTASTGQVVMGSTSNSLVSFRMSETGNVENVKITELVITDTVATSTSKSSFTNLTLWQGNTQVGGPVAESIETSGPGKFKATFSFGTPVIVPQNGTIVLTLKGDVATFTSGGAVDNSAHQLQLDAASRVTAFGQSSNTSLTGANLTGLSSAVSGNTQTVLRSKLTVSGATLGATSGRTRSAVDNVATLTFTADPAYDVTVNTLTLKFQGLAVSNGTAINARLIDPSTGTDWSGLTTGTCTTGVGNSCSVTWTLFGGTIPTITQGTSKSVYVRVDSSSFSNGANTGDSMSILVNAVGDVNWGDGTTTIGLNLEAKVVPLSIASLSYE
ncbi:MAG: peptidoglycan-binding protein [Patescibacteria group bacterium]|mgnify:CR=1 FL=1